MINTDKLYHAFGELLYAISMADGDIQKSEKEAIIRALKGHDMVNVILNSINDQETRKIGVDEAFRSALNTLKSHGPFEEYNDFYVILKEVAKSFEGIESGESRLLEIFNHEFLH